MNYVIDSIIIVATILGLWWGAVWVVEAASRIAKRLGVSELIIGLTVVAMGTSAPEFAVTVGAALKGQADISIGNVVGSNIFNLGFILGGVALVRAISTSRSLIYRDGALMIGITFLLLFFLRDLAMARWEGAILMALLAAYIGFLIYQKDGSDEELPEGEFQWLDIPRLLGGLALIVTSGHYLVESASSLARAVGVSEWVIGVTIVAAGTSAPELVTSLIAVLRGHYGISAGNLIGSDIFNLLGVLGLAAILQPMRIDPSAYTSLYVLSGMVILAVILMRTGWKLSRWEGALLLIINIVRWIMDFQR
ncbi:MAG: sodium:calcium antiporter [Anaerolineaceae bacterium]|jgi:cation:H+ antiporter|nr:MAG: sodium:calcium antiporter [Anaerolineaceae bacterium]